MPTNPPQQSADPAAVEAAIAQVLQAEQAARAATQADAELASRTIELARAQAVAIAERAARCIARVHRWTDAHIARQLALVAEQRSGLNDVAASPARGAAARHGRDSASTRESIETVAAGLAAQLTGDTA